MGQKPSGGNALGLYDVTGNVWEWCFDWWIDYLGSTRIRRGGGWIVWADKTLLGRMSGYNPDHEYGNIGIRLVRTAQ